MPITDRPTFLLRHLAPVPLIAAVLVMLERTPLDTIVSGWFFDHAANVFPLRYNIFLEVVMHQWAKELVIVVAVLVMVLFGMSFLAQELRRSRRVLLFLGLGLSLAPLTVALMKAGSVRHCPWNLTEYGGFAPHLTLFDAATTAVQAGHCFPAGHASTGFCLLAFYFAGRALGQPKLARAGLVLGIAGGLVLGASRILQGAHFLSHVLWSGLVCWTVIVVLFGAIVLSQPRPEPVPAI
jgi:membrane-associated PAP2 superfamily phosphatase